MKYAPHEGSFASRGGLVEQITFAADQGFTAWEDNEAVARPVAQLDAMAKALQQRGMTMGVLVASMPKWSQFRPLLRSEEHTSELQSLMRISYAVFCLKNKNNTQHKTQKQHMTK